MQEICMGDCTRPLFNFQKTFYMNLEQMFSALHFGSPRLGHRMKTNCIKFPTVDH